MWGGAGAIAALGVLLFAFWPGSGTGPGPVPVPPPAELAWTQEPKTSISVVEGTPVSLESDAKGEGSLRFQWERQAGPNWTPIGGASSKSYSISNTRPADSGRYRVTVADQRTRLLGRAVDLTVSAKPVPLPPLAPMIDSPSTPIYLDEGQALTLTGSGGGPGIELVWMHNGRQLANETSATYKVEAAKLEQAGTYKLKAKRGKEEKESSEVKVTVTAKDIVARLEISPTNSLVAKGEKRSVRVVGAPEGSSYEWLVSGVAATNKTARLTVNWEAKDEPVEVRVKVSRSGKEASFTNRFTMAWPPEITALTGSGRLEVNEGDKNGFKLEVEANGAKELSYAWGKGSDTNVLSRVSTYQKLGAVSEGDGGEYWVKVSNRYATASQKVVVAVKLTPPALTTDPADKTTDKEYLVGQTIHWKAQGSHVDSLEWYWDATKWGTNREIEFPATPSQIGTHAIKVLAYRKGVSAPVTSQFTIKIRPQEIAAGAAPKKETASGESSVVGGVTPAIPVQARNSDSPIASVLTNTIGMEFVRLPVKEGARTVEIWVGAI
jgi:hypothetical protein